MQGGRRGGFGNGAVGGVALRGGGIVVTGWRRLPHPPCTETPQGGHWGVEAQGGRRGGCGDETTGGVSPRGGERL